MVTKAVLPVAGLGTRFLPASKAIPKEMVTVVDKPVIQYVVEEALAAGINEIVLVTHSSKKAIEDHFDVNYELEAELEWRGKNELLQVLRDIAPPQLKVTAVRQGRALGLGHAVYCRVSAVPCCGWRCRRMDWSGRTGCSAIRSASPGSRRVKESSFRLLATPRSDTCSTTWCPVEASAAALTIAHSVSPYTSINMG